jgi:hypothetical protein
MVNVLESTLEWTEGEVIVNSGIGSHTPCFSLDSASGSYISLVLLRGGGEGDANRVEREDRVKWDGHVHRHGHEHGHGRTASCVEKTVMSERTQEGGN